VVGRAGRENGSPEANILKSLVRVGGLREGKVGVVEEKVFRWWEMEKRFHLGKHGTRWEEATVIRQR